MAISHRSRPPSPARTIRSSGKSRVVGNRDYADMVLYDQGRSCTSHFAYTERTGGTDPKADRENIHHGKSRANKLGAWQKPPVHRASILSDPIQQTASSIQHPAPSIQHPASSNHLPSIEYRVIELLRYRDEPK
jgi:hypothetical protein